MHWPPSSKRGELMSVRKKDYFVYIFILPAVLFMAIFIGYPTIYNIVLSFQNVDLRVLSQGGVEFVGLDNYRHIMSQPAFSIALSNTLTYTVLSIIFQFTIGFLLALFFAQKVKGLDFLRGLVMIAWLIPQTVTALLFRFMMGSREGIINQMLLNSGLVDTAVGFLTNQHMALYSIIAVNIWVGVPFNMLLISTGLASLPEEVYEAAEIEGANGVQRLFFITIPMLAPVLRIVLMLGFIFTFKVFDLVFVMTGGGPLFYTEVLSTLAFRHSFVNFNFSHGAAMANILFLVLFIISIFYLFLSRKDEAA